MIRRDKMWMAAALGGSVAIAAIYAWPGLMTYDSIEQLRQARAGEYTDWHPPIMSALWGVLDAIVAGPALMFVLQIALFAGGLYAVLHRRLNARASAIWTLVVLAFPPTLTLMATVVKDSLMCGALLLGVAGLLARRRGVRLAALGAFALAAALRYNAFAAVVPMIAWLSPWPASRGRWLRRGVGAAIGVGVSGLGLVANLALRPEPAHMFELGLVPEDIVGALAFAHDLPDDDVRALLDGVPLVRDRDLQAQARALHDPDRFPLDLVRGPDRFFDEPATADARAAEVAAWKRTVAAHPFAYLAGRADRFRWLLGLTDGPWEPVYTVQLERHTLLVNHKPEIPHGVVQRWLGRRMRALGRHALMFRPYLYLVLALALVIARRRDPLQVALGLGTLGYLAGLFFVAPAPDIRYAQWLIVTALVGFALHVGEVTTSRESGNVAAP